MMSEETWKDDITAGSLRLTEWREQNQFATLTEIELAVEAELSLLRERLVTDLVQNGAEETKSVCPNCNQSMVKNGRATRKLRGKDGTTITLDRTQMKCQQCGMTFFPSG